MLAPMPKSAKLFSTYLGERSGPMTTVMLRASDPYLTSRNATFGFGALPGGFTSSTNWRAMWLAPPTRRMLIFGSWTDTASAFFISFLSTNPVRIFESDRSIPPPLFPSGATAAGAASENASCRPAHRSRSRSRTMRRSDSRSTQHAIPAARIAAASQRASRPSIIYTTRLLSGEFYFYFATPRGVEVYTYGSTVDFEWRDGESDIEQGCSHAEVLMDGVFLDGKWMEKCTTDGSTTEPTTPFVQPPAAPSGS